VSADRLFDCEGKAPPIGDPVLEAHAGTPQLRLGSQCLKGGQRDNPVRRTAALDCAKRGRKAEGSLPARELRVHT
jgi:hypothetical protein